MKYLITILAMLALPAPAATYYYPMCDTGAHASCSAGNDSNDGLSAASPKATFPTSFVAGNSYKLARGGAWTALAARTLSSGTSKDTPIVIEDYTPSGCTGDCATQKPILAFTSSGFQFFDGGNADHDEGYALTNLDIRGAGYAASCNTGTGHVSGAYGVWGYNDSDYVTITGVSINGFEIGINIGTGGTVNPGADKLQSYWTIKTSTICHSKTQGLLGSGPYMLVQDNTFDNNGHNLGVDASPNDRDHSIYVGVTSLVTPGVILRGNTITRNSIRASSACTSTSLVGHGRLPDLLVENNTLVETASLAGCAGIMIDGNTNETDYQDMSRAVFRGNVVALTGSAIVGISCNSCPNAIFENNTVVRLGGTADQFVGIGAPYGTASTVRGDVSDGGAIVRNNSIYITSTDSASRGISFGSGNANNKQETVLGNLIYYASGSSASAVCFYNQSARAANTYAAFDRNLCYRVGGANTWSSDYASLALSQAAGLNTNSLTSDPTLTATPAS